MTTGPSVGLASKGLLQGSLVGVDNLRMVAYEVELLGISRYCQWDNLDLECTVVVVASAVPLARNQCDFRWTNAVGRTVVCMVADAPTTQLRDTVARIQPCPFPSLSNGSHNCR